MCGWVSYVWTHKLYTPKYISYMTCIIQYLSLKKCRFSRRVLWLEVGTTNNDPRVIASYYITCVKLMNGNKFIVSELGLALTSDISVVIYVGVPCILRCDFGTENSTLAFMQPFLRRMGGDHFSGSASFRYGRSTTSQVVIVKDWRHT